MECPKRYGSYDQRNDNCPVCKKGKLYQDCKCSKDCTHSACAGWNDEDGRTYYCEHYPDPKKPSKSQ